MVNDSHSLKSLSLPLSSMEELLIATGETLWMTIASLFLSYAFALPLAILTNESSPRGLFSNRILNTICNVIIGIGRAIPFTILMVLILPLTRILVGTGVGTNAVIVPLTFAAVPFVARVIEQSLNEVSKEIVEAAMVDGVGKLKIIFHIKIGSRMYDIVNSVGITSIAIVSYTAMSGAVGGGGLGSYALTHGYYRYDWLSVLWATIIIVVIVLLLQLISKCLSKIWDWR